MKEYTSKKVDIFKSIGLALVFVGMQLNTAIRNVIPGFNGVVVIMLLSFFLLIDIGGIKRLKFNKSLFGIFLFQVVLMMLAILSDNGIGQLISFHLFLISTIIALNSNTKCIRFEYFEKFLLYFSGFISLVVLFQATDGFTKLQTSFYGTGKLWLTQGGDPITMPRALEMNLIVCLFCKDKNRVDKIFTILFLISDLIGLLSFSNRSTIVVSFFVFVIWIIQNIKRINIKRMILLITGLVIVVLLFKNVSYFSDKINMLSVSVERGISTLFGFGSDVVDSSAQSRIDSLLAAKDAINQNGLVESVLVGTGYNNLYLDRPFIQAFVDLGVFGGIAYFVYMIIVPVRCIIRTFKKKYRPNEAWIYVVFFSFQTIIDQIITGIPYYFFLWTPTIFLLFSIQNSKCEKEDIVLKESVCTVHSNEAVR